MKKIFITGTDTDIGKTTNSLFLLKALQKAHPNCDLGYYKPIQTGSELGTDSQFISEMTTNVGIEKETYLFSEPISPNRAAKIHDVHIEIEKISKDLNSLNRDMLVIEGAGGLEVPISEKKRISDIPKHLNIPIIIVASTKLGTINHTILTVEAARSKGLEILGIILSGNQDSDLKEVLEEQTGIRIVGEIPYFDKNEFSSGLDKANLFFDSFFLEELYVKIEEESSIWYPFTQHSLRKQNYEVIKGEGAFLYLKDGRKIYDAISSWWVNIHGHSNNHIAEAIAKQSKELEHTILAGFNHAPAKKLANELIDLTGECGGNFSKVFFSDNGSTSVEVALKMAYQHHQNIGKERTKFISLKNSYHGDTLGAMSVSSRNSFHSPFEKLLFDVDFVEPDNFDDLKKLESNCPEEYAAFIVEPLIQGAGGMKIYSSDFLREIRKFCFKYNITLIFDEVFTGFGRLDSYFAFERAGVIPDIICLSKGISGGFLPISVTITNNNIYNSFLSNRIDKAFLHGHSYTGNPIACAASLASLTLLRDNKSIENRISISKATSARIARLKEREVAFNCRSIGTIGAFEIDNDENYFSSNFSYDFFDNALNKGVLLRPLGKTIYTVPPLCSTTEDVNFVYDVIEELIDEYKR